MDGAIVMGKKLSLDRMLQYLGIRESDVPATVVSIDADESQASIENPTFPTAREEFSALLFKSDALLGRAHRVDLEDCVRILSVYCAQYRSRFGDLPLAGTVEILTSGTMDDDQIKVVAEGLDLVVNVLGLMEEPAADIR